MILFPRRVQELRDGVFNNWLERHHITLTGWRILDRCAGAGPLAVAQLKELGGRELHVEVPECIEYFAGAAAGIIDGLAAGLGGQFVAVVQGIGEEVVVDADGQGTAGIVLLRPRFLGRSGRLLDWRRVLTHVRRLHVGWLFGHRTWFRGRLGWILARVSVVLRRWIRGLPRVRLFARLDRRLLGVGWRRLSLGDLLRRRAVTWLVRGMQQRDQTRTKDQPRSCRHHHEQPDHCQRPARTPSAPATTLRRNGGGRVHEVEGVARRGHRRRGHDSCRPLRSRLRSGRRRACPLRLKHQLAVLAAHRLL